MSSSKKFSAILEIGGAVTSSVKTVIGKTTKDISKIGDAIRSTEKEQAALNKTMAEMSKNGPAQIGGLIAKYKELGGQLEKLKTQQKQLREAEEQTAKRLAFRGKMLGAAAIAGAGTAVMGGLMGEALHKAVAINTTMFNAAARSQFSGGKISDIDKMTPKILDIAKATNRSPEEVAEEYGFAASMNMGEKDRTGPEKAIALTKAAARQATALGEDMHDWGEIFYSGMTTMGVASADLGRFGDVMGQVAHAGHFASLAHYGPSMFALGSMNGMTGIKGAAEIGMMLQLARTKAGTDQLAETNVRNMIASIVTPKFDRATQKQVMGINAGLNMNARAYGLDVEKIYTGAMKKGLNPIIEVLKVLKKVVTNKDGSIDMFKMSKLFGKQYSENGALALISGDNLEEFARKLKELLGPNGDGKGAVSENYIDKLSKEREGTIGYRVEALKNNFEQLAIKVGVALVPALESLLTTVTPIVEKVADWVEKNPELTADLALAVTGVLALATASFTLSAATTFAKPLLTGLASVLGKGSALELGLTATEAGATSLGAAGGAGGLVGLGGALGTLASGIGLLFGATSAMGWLFSKLGPTGVKEDGEDHSKQVWVRNFNGRGGNWVDADDVGMEWTGGRGNRHRVPSADALRIWQQVGEDSKRETANYGHEGRWAPPVVNVTVQAAPNEHPAVTGKKVGAAVHAELKNRGALHDGTE